MEDQIQRVNEKIHDVIENKNRNINLNNIEVKKFNREIAFLKKNLQEI